MQTLPKMREKVRGYLKTIKLDKLTKPLCCICCNYAAHLEDRRLQPTVLLGSMYANTATMAEESARIFEPSSRYLIEILLKCDHLEEPIAKLMTLNKSEISTSEHDHQSVSRKAKEITS